MEAVYNWIKSIVFYMIFMTLVFNMLPGKNYERYLKLFTGMVLILLVIRPLTGGMRLDQAIAGYFETFSFQSEAGELRGQMEEMERKRLERLMEGYEEAASEQVEARLREKGYGDTEVSVTLNGDASGSSFGTVETVEILLEEQEKGQEEKQGDREEIQESAGEAREREETTQGSAGEDQAGEGRGGEIRPVEISRVRLEDQEEGGEDFSQVSAPGKAGNRELEGIKKEIADYYGMEESHVKIRFKEP